jgi:hypothetical protein
MARIVQRMVDKAEERRANFAFGKPEEHLDAAAAFYADMIGSSAQPDGSVKQEDPVDTHLALGMPRNTRREGAGAVIDAATKGKSQMYDHVPAMPEEYRQQVSAFPDGRSNVESVPVLKPEYQHEDVFYPRDTEMYSAPGGRADANIKHFMPAAQARFTELRSQDTQKILEFLIPDGIHHMHVQIEKPKPAATRK